MNITISTCVNRPYRDVKEGFNEELLTKLSPPFPPVKITHFGGSEVGDLVKLQINLGITKLHWVSKITEASLTDSEYFFVDEGVELPFFLGKWKHRHRIIRMEDHQTEIRDEISYSGRFAWLTPLLYPVFMGQFLYRIPIYKRVFR